mgnify:CR=1 FL=1
MNYRETSIAEGSKYLGFWWYMFVELVLIVTALIAIAGGKYETGFIIFILIEVREINSSNKAAKE